MYESFSEYMYYLLTSPFKKVKKSVNQWYILFRVLGKRFDDAMESIYRAREETMIATCSEEMLEIHAEDRNMVRYRFEALENFRIRIANYTEVCRLGGTNEGVILAVKSLGYSNVKIVKAKELTGDILRWAEFYVFITVDVDEEHPIALDILQREVRRTKEVGAKDNYAFNYTLAIEEKQLIGQVKYEGEYSGYSLNGEYNLDGTKKLNGYEVTEELPMRYATSLVRRSKMAEASNNTGVLAKAKWIALGTGGIDENGEVITPLVENTQLKKEIIRKEYYSSYKASSTSYQYVIRLDEDELVGQSISEIALVDEEGDVIAFANINPKYKDATQVEFTIEEKF